jgi:hypothetical protein
VNGSGREPRLHVAAQVRLAQLDALLQLFRNLVPYHRPARVPLRFFRGRKFTR